MAGKAIKAKRALKGWSAHVLLLQKNEKREEEVKKQHEKE